MRLDRPPRPNHWRALDIWPAFSHTGADADSWDAQTYAGFIAGIDDALEREIDRGDVVKETLGTASDGTSSVYAYTAGDGPNRVILNAGTHGNEKIGIYAAMRWFQQFAQSDAAEMVELRRALSVTYVPCLNPNGYRSSRFNANSVNINRNFGFFWSSYTPGDAKGSSAFDQAEAALIRDLIDEANVRVVIDCHDYDNEDSHALIYVGPSTWTLGQRSLVESAVDAWNAVYNPDGSLTTEDLLPNDGLPALINWAQWRMRWSKGRKNAAVVTVEGSGTLSGSTSTNTTRTAMKLYNGFITLFLQRWLIEGQQTPTPYAFQTHAWRQNEAASTSIASGGTLIDTGTATPLTFELVVPTNSVQSQDYVDIVVPYAPALIAIEASGYIESSGSTGRVDVSVTKDGTLIDMSPTSAQVPATTGERVNFVLHARDSISTTDAASIYRYRLVCTRVTAVSSKLKRYRMLITVYPHTNEHAVPLVNP